MCNHQQARVGIGAESRMSFKAGNLGETCGRWSAKLESVYEDKLGQYTRSSTGVSRQNNRRTTKFKDSPGHYLSL